MELNKLTIKQAHQGLKNKDFSAIELTENVLNKIKKQNNSIHAYLTITEELALSQAKKVDKKIQNKEEIGPLAGIPLAVKDLILVEGIKTTAGSKILENYIAPYDATVIKNLKKLERLLLEKLILMNLVWVLLQKILHLVRLKILII